MSASAAGRTAPPPGALLLSWATGGAVLCACVDFLLAVLAGLEDVPLRRALALPLGVAAHAGLGVAAFSWTGGRTGVAVAAAWHLACVAGAWFGFPILLKGPVPGHLHATLAAHAVAAAMALPALGIVGRGDGAELRRALGAAAATVWENFESVLVAVVFALAVRHFAVEAYKIPTESMSPNLLGDSEPHRPGDRVLVEKWSALLSGPKRFEVWVFRPPLDRSINFVKRVAGLPGETITIKDGDLYVDGKVARKPPRILEDMWCAVYPSPIPSEVEDTPWSGEGCRKDGDAFRIEGAKERRLLQFGRPVRDGPLHAGGARPVGDVRVRFDAGEVEAGTRFVVRLIGRAGPVEARIDAAGGGETLVNGTSTSFAGAWTSVRTVDVAFVDLELVVTVNGTVATRVEAEPQDAGGRIGFSVAFGVERGGARFEDVRLDRDVYYTDAPRPFRVPDGSYFFLGDNSGMSQDSRAWRGFVLQETGEGGRRFLSASPPRQSSEEEFVEFTDRDGVRRRYRRDEVKTVAGPDPTPFIPASDLHGRAFAVFWPPSWVSKVKNRIRWLP